MRIYTAASWAIRDKIKFYIDILLDCPGVGVGATWVWGDDGDLYPLYFSAASDLADIDAADVVLVFTEHPSTSGGFHVETGYALAKGKRVVIIGERINLFHHLPQVQVYPTLEAFIKDMAQ